MKKAGTLRKATVVAGAALLLAAAIALAAETVQVAAMKTVQVAVMKTALRKDKHFYSPSIATAELREVLILLGEEGEWLRVKKGETEGWIHRSATAGKAPKAKGDRNDPGVSQDDVTLAGKGFNSQVEGDYKKKNPKLDFAAVDRLQGFTAREKELEEFAKAGRLQPGEEGK